MHRNRTSDCKLRAGRAGGERICGAYVPATARRLCRNFLDALERWALHKPSLVASLQLGKGPAAAGTLHPACLCGWLFELTGKARSTNAALRLVRLNTLWGSRGRYIDGNVGDTSCAARDRRYVRSRVCRRGRSACERLGSAARRTRASSRRGTRRWTAAGRISGLEQTPAPGLRGGAQRPCACAASRHCACSGVLSQGVTSAIFGPSLWRGPVEHFLQHA